MDDRDPTCRRSVRSGSAGSSSTGSGTILGGSVPVCSSDSVRSRRRGGSSSSSRKLTSSGLSRSLARAQTLMPRGDRSDGSASRGGSGIHDEGCPDQADATDIGQLLLHGKKHGSHGSHGNVKSNRLAGISASSLSRRAHHGMRCRCPSSVRFRGIRGFRVQQLPLTFIRAFPVRFRGFGVQQLPLKSIRGVRAPHSQRRRISIVPPRVQPPVLTFVRRNAA